MEKSHFRAALSRDCLNPQTIVAFLDKQSLLFTETADVLAKMARESLVQARYGDRSAFRADQVTFACLDFRVSSCRLPSKCSRWELIRDCRRASG